MVSSIGLRSYRRGTLKDLPSRCHPPSSRSLTTSRARPLLPIKYGLLTTTRAYPDSPCCIKAFRIFIDPFPGHFQPVILRGCLIRKCACTLEPHDFYRPFARLDHTHHAARLPTIGCPHPWQRSTCGPVASIFVHPALILKIIAGIKAVHIEWPMLRS